MALSKLNKTNIPNYPVLSSLPNSHILKVGSLSTSSSTWILDSGASNSYSWDRSSFESFKDTFSYVTVGNGQRLQVQGIGNVILLSVWIWTQGISVENEVCMDGIRVGMNSCSNDFRPCATFVWSGMNPI